MKSAWMSSSRAQCYLRQRQESLAHHQEETSLYEATVELSEGKEFRDFRWLQPTPLITLVLSNGTSTLAACVDLKLTVLICECLCAYSGVR